MKHLTTFRVIDAIERTGSIRSAAEVVSQTPSAVQRRLQNYEHDIGVALFERSSRGVRLSAAGELIIVHIRETLAETERLKSRIADLEGIRRGHVSIGCSQALVPYFLPRQIAQYQVNFPKVTFDVKVIEHENAAELLDRFAVDITLVFSGQSGLAYDVGLAVPQRIAAIMAADHPLSASSNVRLRQCYEYPVVMPKPGYGSRAIIDRVLFGKTYAKSPILESNSFEYLRAHVAATDSITFQIEIGAPDEHASTATVSRPIHQRDVGHGLLLLGQKRDRTLPVAASRFVEQMTKSLGETYEFDVRGEPFSA